MIALVPDLLSSILEPSDGNTLPFEPRPTPGAGLNWQVNIVGTAHFTRKSVADAMKAVSSGEYRSVALELDSERFAELELGSLSAPPALREIAGGEFVAAADALGNRDGDIWLIDMSMQEIRSRISAGLDDREAAGWDYVSRRLVPYEYEGLRQWEEGKEDRAMSYLDLTTRAMKEYSPTMYRVLIEERNLLMAARLQEVAALSAGRVLVLVGKAHVDGIRRLLTRPGRIPESLREAGLNYSPPTRIRRVRVN